MRTGWKESAADAGTPGAANNSSPLPDENMPATTTEPMISPASKQPSFIADAGENIAALTGDEVFFDGSKSQGGAILTFLWNFGDGTTKEGKQVLHRYSFPGNYIVTLKISDGIQSAEDQARADIYPNGVSISEFYPSSPREGDWPSYDDCSALCVRGWIELSNQAAYGVDISGWGL